MNKGIQTDPEGFTMLDGTRYSWSEVEVALEVKAHIKLPDNPGEVVMTGSCEGPGMGKFLVALLDATLGDPELLQ